MTRRQFCCVRSRYLEGSLAVLMPVVSGPWSVHICILAKTIILQRSNAFHMYNIYINKNVGIFSLLHCCLTEFAKVKQSIISNDT